MTGIIPFKGLLYDPLKVSIKDVIAPPYDVITPGKLEALYAKSPYNISRVDCGKDAPGDGEKNNKYLRSASALQQWKKDGIMKYTENAAFYLYETTYTTDTQKKTMRGIFAAGKLFPLGTGVFPHELTNPKPKQDRLNLLHACRANISPVFTLYDSPNPELKSLCDRIQSSVAYFECTDEDGIFHRFWIIDDSDDIGLIKEAISGLDMFIADGHHRYETSLEYQRIMRGTRSSTAENENSYDYVLMLLVNVSDGDITILPTHRLLRNIPENPVGKLNGMFKVEHVKECPDIGDAIKGKIRTFGLYLPGEGGFYTLEYTGDVPAGLFGIDVMILHEIIFKKLYNVLDFGYEMDIKKTVEKVNEGDYKAAFILNPTKVQDVVFSAKVGVRMPAKSTYFYPKIPTGLVLNSLEP